MISVLSICGSSFSQSCSIFTLYRFCKSFKLCSLSILVANVVIFNKGAHSTAFILCILSSLASLFLNSDHVPSFSLLEICLIMLYFMYLLGSNPKWLLVLWSLFDIGWGRGHQTKICKIVVYVIKHKNIHLTCLYL